jgi:hypothetical protein
MSNVASPHVRRQAPARGNVIHSDSPVDNVTVSPGLTWRTRIDEKRHPALAGEISTL